MTGRLTAAGYGLGWAVLRRLPLALVWLIFRVGADLAARRGGRGTARLRTNLARVMSAQQGSAQQGTAPAPAAPPASAAPPAPPAAALDELTRRALRSYARYWLEVFRLPSQPASVVAARTDVAGTDRLMAAVAEGRGVILALPHMGNWDQAGVWLIEQGVDFTTVAERLRPESLFDRFVAFREGLGMEVIALTGGTSPPFELLEQRLRAGGTLCLLADRDLTPSGVEVSLFGQTATMPAGPALLALRTGAALFPVSTWWSEPDPPSPLRARIHDQVGVPTGVDTATAVGRMTQQVADAFAEAIRAHPADWHMLARLWQADLDPRRAAAPAPAAPPPATPPPPADLDESARPR